MHGVVMGMVGCMVMATEPAAAGTIVSSMATMLTSGDVGGASKKSDHHDSFTRGIGGARTESAKSPTSLAAFDESDPATK